MQISKPPEPFRSPAAGPSPVSMFWRVRPNRLFVLEQELLAAWGFDPLWGPH